jgi:hypothetical protein
MTEKELRDRLRKVEALFAGAATAGERAAAAAARERLRARLAELCARTRSDERGDWERGPRQGRAGPRNESVEMRFSIADPWSRQLFEMLARRHGLRLQRRARQRQATVILRGPASLIKDVFWPEFEQLNDLLASDLAEVTRRIIIERVFPRTDDL